MERALYTYGIITMSAAIALAGHEWIDWRCLTASDWAAWFGAVGTIGTLIGTIVLATQESRRRNREIRSKARIIIPSLTMKLIAAGIAFDKTVKAFSTPRLPTKEMLLRESAKLRAIPLWTPEDANALAHLPNDIATQLMLIKETVEAVANALEFTPNNWVRMVVDSVDRLNNGITLIDAVLHECNVEYHGADYA